MPRKKLSPKTRISNFLKKLKFLKKRPTRKKRQKGGNLTTLSYKLGQLPRIVKYMKRK